MYKKKPSSNNNRDLMRYAGLSSQILVSLGIAVFAGYKGDQWLHLHIPLLIWLLPLIVLCLLIYNLIKETSKRKDTNDVEKTV